MSFTKVLIAANNVRNAYIPSLAEAYKRAGCEVVVGVENLYISKFYPDILHLHWPEYLYRPDHSLFGEPMDATQRIIRQYKDYGAKVVYTIHNISPHESFDESLENDIYQFIYEMSDVIVHHGKKSIDLMSAKFPMVTGKNNIICHHGDYLIQYKNISKMRAREKLNLPPDKFVLLCFGNIRQYKGFSLLKKIFGCWKKENKYLLVAGSYSVSSGNSLSSWLGVKVRKKWLSWKRNPFIYERRYDLYKIKTMDIAYYFSAADAVILTHTLGLTSGILAMAATFKKAVVYPDIGNFSEQMEGWISESFTANDVTSAVDALQRLSNRLEQGCSLDNSIWLANNSWAEHVEKILSAVQNMRNV